MDSLTRGVTTVLEPGTVAHPPRLAAGLRAAGIRAKIGGWGWDTPGLPYAKPWQGVLATQEALVGELGVDGLVTLVGHELVSDELLTGAAELTGRLGTGMTWHISPDERDVTGYLRRTGRRPVEHFADLGVLGPDLLLAHSVCLDDAELDLLLASRTAIASRPAAYLRLG